MYAETNRVFATKYFWWFFQIQPAPLPEKLISADPAFYLREHLSVQSKTPGAVSEEVMHEYLRCYQLPNAIHAVREDYRAAAGIDLEQDAQDYRAGKRIGAPLLALWGAKGTVGELYDVLGTWRDKALQVSGKALDCGHLLPEEDPGSTLSELNDTFAGNQSIRKQRKRKRRWSARIICRSLPSTIPGRL